MGQQETVRKGGRVAKWQSGRKKWRQRKIGRETKSIETQRDRDNSRDRDEVWGKGVMLIQSP